MVPPDINLLPSPQHHSKARYAIDVPPHRQPQGRSSCSWEYGCANLSSATASSTWLHPVFAPCHHSSLPSKHNRPMHQTPPITSSMGGIATVLNCLFFHSTIGRKQRRRLITTSWRRCHIGHRISTTPVFVTSQYHVSSHHVSSQNSLPLQ